MPRVTPYRSSRRPGRRLRRARRALTCASTSRPWISCTKGLIGPSAQAWADGAKALKAAPLAGAKLPKDPLLTKERLAAEAAVHALADQAAAATDFPMKTEVYGKLAANCASCHALHGRVWGPGLPKQ